jgi:hypothetical protein
MLDRFDAAESGGSSLVGCRFSFLFADEPLLASDRDPHWGRASPARVRLSDGRRASGEFIYLISLVSVSALWGCFISRALWRNELQLLDGGRIARAPVFATAHAPANHSTCIPVCATPRCLHASRHRAESRPSVQSLGRHCPPPRTAWPLRCPLHCAAQRQGLGSKPASAYIAHTPAPHLWTCGGMVACSAPGRTWGSLPVFLPTTPRPH